MEGYYVEKTWSVTLFASKPLVYRAAFRLYENKTRAISDPPKRKLNGNEICQVAEKDGL